MRADLKLAQFRLLPIYILSDCVEPLFLALKMRLMDCASRDRSGFTGRLRGLHQRARDGKPVDRGLEQLRADIEASIVRLQERRAALPAPEFDDSLPISAHRGAIAAAIHDHQVVVICGETGSGK
ncbi:MAG TPA: hypothetical protein DCS31_05110, partial [Candidatus Competibacteraceae bacterium]|nr:hypothetical protein [Candidatus Competibacteraceae bacterium]